MASDSPRRSHQRGVEVSDESPRGFAPQGRVGVSRDARPDGGPTPRGALDLKGSTHCGDALGGRGKANVTLLEGASKAPSLEAAPVVSHFQEDPSLRLEDPHRHPRRARVLGRVGQQLARRHEKQHVTLARAAGRGNLDLDGDLEAATARRALGHRLDGGREPDVLEDGGMQLEDRIPQLVDGGIERCACTMEVRRSQLADQVLTRDEKKLEPQPPHYPAPGRRRRLRLQLDRPGTELKL
jgi:hypothetical protein